MLDLDHGGWAELIPLDRWDRIEGGKDIAMTWLRSAWTAASRRQKATILIAAILGLGGLASLSQPATVPGPSAGQPPGAPVETTAPAETPTTAAAATASAAGSPKLNPKPTAKPTPKATPKPTPKATLSLAFTSLTSPISPGSDATATSRTAPGAYCTITVEYASGPSKAAGLGPTTTGSSGVASWTWKVGTRTTPGDWPVTIDCSKNGLSRSVTRDLHVT